MSLSVRSYLIYFVLCLRPIHYDNKTNLPLHLKMMEEIVRRDKNKPCVIMWSVVNEPSANLDIAEYYFKWVLIVLKNEFFSISKSFSINHYQLTQRISVPLLIHMEIFCYLEGSFSNLCRMRKTGPVTCMKGRLYTARSIEHFSPLGQWWITRGNWIQPVCNLCLSQQFIIRQSCESKWNINNMLLLTTYHRCLSKYIA